jgi:hypothetical protein
VRQQVGNVLRQEPRQQPGQAGVLTVTGLVPSPVEALTAPPSQRPAPSASPTASCPDAEPILAQLVRHPRDLRTLKGRPPFRLAGRETYERLHSVAPWSLDWLATHDEPRLAQWYQGLRSALGPFAETSHALHQGAGWLRDIAYILDPVPPYPLRAADIAGQLRSYRDTGLQPPQVPPGLEAFGRHLDPGSRRSWPGLLHGYDGPGLPRTQNALERHLRETRRRLLRTTGQQGQTQRTLQRPGAWELLPQPPTEATLQEACSQTPSEDLAQERQRYAMHHQRFRLQSRSRRQTQAQCDHLRQQWSALQVTGTG